MEYRGEEKTSRLKMRRRPCAVFAGGQGSNMIYECPTHRPHYAPTFCNANQFDDGVLEVVIGMSPISDTSDDGYDASTKPLHRFFRATTTIVNKNAQKTQGWSPVYRCTQ